MGDRTWVHLTVPTMHRLFVEKIGNYEDEYQDYPQGLTTFYYDEINGGELHFLHKLELAGVPYNSEWGAGAEFSAGTQYGRYNERGEPFVVVINEEDKSIEIEALMEHIDDPEKLKHFILSRYEVCQVTDWEHQLEYAKRYLLRELITPPFPTI